MKHIPESLDHDGRIRLEAYHLGCEEELFDIVKRSQAEIHPWMGWCPPEYCIEDTRERVASRQPAWEAGEEYDFLIKDNESGQILGSCGLNHINYEYNFANLGYWVRSDRTRQNVATEAVAILADFGFTYLKLTRLEILAKIDNIASQRVAEKANALKEGRLRNRIKISDEVHDAYMYSLIPE
ncbi:GNAT family N-acetyltransferase [Puniceicoccaceae bacterium K14]|nr:GNAT family N-acetyltransferase [Puniceicoccaceae bacterium K14]